MRNRRLIGLVCLCLLFSACNPGNIASPSTTSPGVALATEQTLSPTTTSTPLPTNTPTPIPTNEPTLELTATSTMATPEATTSPANGNSQAQLVIDHTSVDLFNSIPDEYIQQAAALHLLHRHASVGKNISDGLDCLMNSVQPRPYFCDKGLDPSQVIYDPKYDRSNWIFELHAPLPNPNPGWWKKESNFIDRINNLGPSETFDYAGLNFCYVDGIPGSNIQNKFFENDPNDHFPSVDDLEALQAAHPDITLIYWTMCLARIVGSPESASFNNQMRTYVQDNGKILMDIADIESHQPDGTPCLTEDGNQIPVLCQEYTVEEQGGHLNALGSLRLAKAMWVMMARLAGWDGMPSTSP